MKKLIIPCSIVVLLALLLLIYTATKTNTTLQPDVKKILEIPLISEEAMDQNAYVHILAINSASKDYVNIAKQYLVQTNELLRKAIKTNSQIKQNEWPTMQGNFISLNTSINAVHYISPCRDLKNEHCIADLLKLEVPLNKLIIENEALLTRYNTIISLPIYQPYYQETLFSNINPRLYYFLSELKQFQAVIAIKQGNFADGLNLLQQEINFAEKIYTSKDSFFDKVIAGNMLLTLYHTMSGLLDETALSDKINDPRLIALLNTLPSQDELNLSLAIADDKYQDLYSLALDIEGAQSMSSAYFNDLKQLASENKIPLTFDLNKTLNNLYLRYQSIEQITQSTTLNSLQRYLKLKDNASKSICNTAAPAFKENFLKNVDKQNVIGDYLLCGSDPVKFISMQLSRLYDVQNYLALVRLKLEIKQKGINAEQIPAFLTDAGDRAINPYTQQPFVWDSEKSMLITDWLYPTQTDQQKAVVEIRFNSSDGGH